MPRQARLDAPGLAHHVMARGLERQKIFRSRDDYEDFLRRIPVALERSPNEILAWALMPNHVHFFLRSGAQGMAGFFRRLFTGYASGFNSRYKRVGYLFQGRYKSLVCDQEEYFLTLVRYIHLNPLAGGIVNSLAELANYPYCGHGALMNRFSRPWQEVDEVLGRFGRNAGQARQGYYSFLRDGVDETLQLPTDLLGGGVLETLRNNLQRNRREEERELFDPRVLGESDFVKRVWDEADKREERAQLLQRKGVGLRKLAKRIALAAKLPERLLFMRGRPLAVSQAKAALIFAGVEYFGKSTTEMAALTRMSVATASQAKTRGQALQRKFGIGKLITDSDAKPPVYRRKIGTE